MQRSKITIAKETLKLLEKQSFEKINILKVVKNKNSYIKNKTDLLININRYFDYLLNKRLSSLENSSQKDMIFEVFMARLDILNENRIAVKKLIKFFISHPQQFIRLIPSFFESIMTIALLCNINVNGIKGLSKIKGLFVLYIIIIFTWNNDDTDSLEKTMTTLDRYLTNLNSIIRFF